MGQVNFITPIGTAVYPWLTKPDYQFVESGKYQTKLSVSKDDKGAQKLITEINNYSLAEFGQKAKVHLPFQLDEETGNFVFTMSTKYKPTFFDASGTPVTDPPNIWGGSQIRIKGAMSSYSHTKKGISLYINAVQIIKAISGGAGDDSGFDAVEMDDAFHAESFSNEAEAGGDGANF